jgi:hypothetical protein
MSSKISILAFAILSVLVFASFASALSFSTSPVTLTSGSPGTQVNLTNNGAFNLTSVTLTPSSSDVAVSPLSFALNVSKSNTISVNSSKSLIDSLSIGSHAYTISALGTNGTDNQTASLSVNLVKSFCASGDVGGNISITNVDISNNGQGNKDKWYRLDTLTIDVDVKNVGSTDIGDDIIVELGLYDSSGNQVIDDLDFTSKDNEQFNIGSLDKSDKQTASFEFKVPADVSSGIGYKFVVKAYVDGSESQVCTDSSSDLSNDLYFKSVEVKRESDPGKLIGFDNIKLTQDTLTCGDTGSLSVTAYNLGSKKQDQTKFTLTNTALGISQSIVVKKDLQERDKALLQFSFAVPTNAKDGTYVLSLDANYGYRSSVDEYEDSLDEPARVSFKVIGCQITPIAPVVNNQTTTTTTEEPATSSFFARAFQGNGLVWTVAIVNILLVIVIILVAVRIARR